MVSCGFRVWLELGLTARNECDDMADSIKEEEMRIRVDLHQHHNAGCDDCKKADDVHDPNAIQDDVAWASERLWRERHLVGLVGCLGFCSLELGCEEFDAAAFERNVQESGNESQCCHLLEAVRYLLVSWVEAQEHVVLAVGVVLRGSGCPAVCGDDLVICHSVFDRRIRGKSVDGSASVIYMEG